jgi:hypothetical protein
MAAVFDNEESDRSEARLDRAAICVSVLCLAQCLLLPLLIVVSPLASLGLFGDELFHLALLGVILPLSLAAFALGYRTHRNRRMLAPGLAGLVVISLAAVLEGGALGHLGSALMTSAGGVLLIIGHWLNLRDRRRVCLRPQ